MFKTLLVSSTIFGAIVSLLSSEGIDFEEQQDENCILINSDDERSVEYALDDNGYYFRDSREGLEIMSVA